VAAARSLRHDVAPVLAEMPSLERVNLGYNQVQGMLGCAAFPPAATRLVELDLAENQLTGSIPACLLGISTLRELYLAGNALTGRLPGLPEGSQLVALSVADQASRPWLTKLLGERSPAAEVPADLVETLTACMHATNHCSIPAWCWCMRARREVLC
jgi:hypothetical protein